MKKIFMTFLFSTAIFLSNCAYYNVFYNARQNYKQAYRATRKNRTEVPTSIEKDNYEKAIVGASKLLQFYPNSRWVDDALFLLGKSFYYQRDYNSARRKFLELKSNFPDSDFSVEVDLWLAKTALALNEYEDAKVQLNRFINQESSRKLKGEGYYHLGRMHSALGEFDDAVTSYEEALNTGIGNLGAEVMYAISSNYDSLGNYTKAAESYQQLLDYDPSEELRFDAEFKYAQMLKKQGLHDEAIKLFETYLGNQRNTQSFPAIKLEMADCLILKNDMDNAITAYQNITSEHKSSQFAAQAHYRLAHIYEKQNKYEDAQEQFGLVKKAYTRSEFADSAQIKRRDILRLQALRKIIDMATRGETASGEVVVADMDSIDRKTQTEIMAQDTVNTPPESFAGNEIEQNNQRNADEEERTEQNTQERKEPVKNKPVENPELKTFRIEELDKNLFLLAELYYFRFSLPDSALSQYERLVNEFPESPHTPRAIFNLINLNEHVFHNSLAAQNGYNRLIKDYPDSEFTNAARRSLGLSVIPMKEDTLNLLYAQAEDALYRLEDPMVAYRQFANIVERYPESEMAPRSQYTMGWIAENRLDSLSLAFVLYDSLVSRYPTTVYAEDVKKKVEFVKKKDSILPSESGKDTVGTVATLADSIIIKKSESGTEDEEKIIPKNPSDKNDLQKDPIDVQSRNRQPSPVGGVENIAKRLKFSPKIDQALLTGVVSVKVFVDRDGTITKTELLRRTKNDEINNIVLKAVQGTQFEPALVNGKPMPSNVEVTVPLNEGMSLESLK